MMRIDRSLLEAARDAGASAWQTAVARGRAAVQDRHHHRLDLRHRLVMGDFVTVGVMGGQQIASVGKIIQVQTAYLQFPAGRGQCGDPAGRGAADDLGPDAPGRPAQGAVSARRLGAALGFWLLAAFFALFVLFLYGPMLAIFVLSFQGPEGGLTFPLRGVSLHWFAKLWEGIGVVDIGAAFRRSLAAGRGGDGCSRCCCRCWPGWPTARSCPAARRCSTWWWPA
jgi:hypothetical protein